jgi:hypothetical protein
MDKTHKPNPMQPCVDIRGLSGRKGAWLWTLTYLYGHGPAWAATTRRTAHHRQQGLQHVGPIRWGNCDPALAPATTDVGTIHRGNYDGNLAPISTVIACLRLNM